MPDQRKTYEITLTSTEILNLIKHGEIRTVFGEESDILVKTTGFEEKTDFTESY